MFDETETATLAPNRSATKSLLTSDEVRSRYSVRAWGMDMDNARLNRICRERISDRQVDELIGLAKGIAADGQIHPAEVEFLQNWLAANLAVSDHPLIGTLYERINGILVDGIVDEDEKSELLDTLRQFTGHPSELGETLKATTLPLCAPAPTISFANRQFCFTGEFTFGKRTDCKAAVIQRGGTIAQSPTRETRYLIIGTYVTDSWRHSSYGNKILKAVEMKNKQLPISIISESHWAQSL